MSQSVPLILICDDDPVVHESLALYLDNDNFSHADAYDGAQALEMASSTNPDLILRIELIKSLNQISNGHNFTPSTSLVFFQASQ